jgi:hypothetical protein
MDFRDIATTLGRIAAEIGLYSVGSPNSRLRQIETLHQLDARQLADIGLKRENLCQVRTGLTGDRAGSRRDFSLAPDFARY